MEDRFQSHFARAYIRVLMADLARLKQQPREMTKQFIMRFKQAKIKCFSGLSEVEFIKLAQDGLDYELRKKFERMTFLDLFELSKRATHYESVLKEENQQRTSSYETYYQDLNYEVDLAEFVGNRPFTSDALAMKDTQA